MTWVSFVNVFVFFVLPGTILAFYQSGLNVSLLQLAVFSFPVILGSIILLFVLLRRLPNQARDFVGLSLLLIISIALYNTYFNDYGGKIIDGDPDVFDSKYGILDYFVILSLTVTILYFRRPIANRLALIFGILILAGTGNLIAETLDAPPASRETADKQSLTPQLYSFSADRNVIHIVLDGMQGTVFSDILKKNPEFSESFQGFTFFPDALTASEMSYLSFPSFYSGWAYQGHIPISDYLRQTGMNRAINGDDLVVTPAFLMALHERGFDLDILANTGSAMHSRSEYRSHAKYRSLNKSDTVNEIARLTDLLLIRILPWIGKRYIYRDGSWYFSASYTNLPRSNKAEKVLREFVGSINVDNTKPTYKLIHLISPHGPWTTSADCHPQIASRSKAARYNQSTCITIATMNFLDDLRHSVVYDNSLILIHGDHGICQGMGLPETGNGRPLCIGNINPLVLIKPPGNRDALTISKNLVELTDLPATISDILSLPFYGPGQSMMDNRLNPDRVRIFYRFVPNQVKARRLDRYTKVMRYYVKGSIFDASSWRSETTENPYKEIEDIPFGEVVKIEKIRKFGTKIKVVSGDKPAKKYMYIESGGEKMPLKINKKRFIFRVPKSYPSEPMYLVDPIRDIKQEILIGTN